jgi:hypothetical protein
MACVWLQPHDGTHRVILLSRQETPEGGGQRGSQDADQGRYAPNKSEGHSLVSIVAWEGYSIINATNVRAAIVITPAIMPVVSEEAEALRDCWR